MQTVKSQQAVGSCEVSSSHHVRDAGSGWPCKLQHGWGSQVLWSQRLCLTQWWSVWVFGEPYAWLHSREAAQACWLWAVLLLEATGSPGETSWHFQESLQLSRYHFAEQSVTLMCFILFSMFHVPAVLEITPKDLRWRAVDTTAGLHIMAIGLGQSARTFLCTEALGCGLPSSSRAWELRFNQVSCHTIPTKAAEEFSCAITFKGSVSLVPTWACPHPPGSPLHLD